MSKDNTNEEKIIDLTVAEATAIVEDRKATEAVAKSKAEHTALNDKLKAFNANMAQAYRVLLEDRGNAKKRLYDEVILKEFQHFFDLRANGKEAEKVLARSAISQMSRALRTATDLKAKKAKLWSKNHSISCNTIGNDGKAKLDIKNHETEAEKTARIAKEAEAQKEAEAKKVYDSAVTYSEAVSNWSLEDLKFIEAQLKAKFELEKKKQKWELNENSEVIALAS